MAKTTKPQKPDFDSLKNSYDEYKDGEMTLSVTVPDMEDLDSADHNVEISCWFNDKYTSRSYEDIFKVELYVYDLKLFKKYAKILKNIKDLII